MNKQLSLKDFFIFGIFFSVCWHIFWIFLFNPMIERPFLKRGSGDCVFLGQILDDADFEVHFFKKNEDPLSRSKVAKDLSKEERFFKAVVNFDKPLAIVRRESSAGHEGTHAKKKTVADTSLRKLREVSFGPSNFGPYVENVDFSDCRPYFSREDLLGFVDVDVFLNADGSVQSIKKVTTCGDPAVDLVVLRKLKHAVFKDRFFLKTWIRVRFKLK